LLLAYPFHAKATNNVGPPIGELLGNHHVRKYIGEEIKAKEMLNKLETM
jgi:hypothetical protein